MLKIIERNGACIVVFENPSSLETDLMNECKKLEATYKEESYKQISFVKNMEAQAKNITVSKKPSREEEIQMLLSVPSDFMTEEDKAKILKEKYDYEQEEKEEW